MKNLVDAKKVIRDLIFESGLVERLTFSYLNPRDYGEHRSGDLFEQDEDFLLLDIDGFQTGRVGPGRYTQVRAYTALDLVYFTKSNSDPLGVEQRLERIADVFQQETLRGLRFKTYAPTGELRDRGFVAYSGTIPFNFDISAKH